MEQGRPHDDGLDIPRRIYDALCGQYPDQFIMLCDAQGRILASHDGAYGFDSSSGNLAKLTAIRRFVPGQQIGRRSPARLFLKVETAERLSGAVVDDEAGLGALDPRWYVDAATRGKNIVGLRR